MLSYDEALAQILASAQTLNPVNIPLQDALDLVLAEDVTSPINLPPFTNSAMDGYAVRAGDVYKAIPEQPISLPVVGEVAAGGTPPPLQPGTALRIMTGAPLPAEADAVVPVEDTRQEGDQVLVLEAAAPGQFIREAGNDIRAGETVLVRDTVLRPVEIGMAAAVGRDVLRVHPRPRVAVLSTGDELIPPGGMLRSGEIYNSNAYALAALVAETGGMVVLQRHAQDTPEALRAAFDECRDVGTNVILSSGGVSMGHHDYVKSVFGERGSVDFWRVAIRPGKPLAFGRWGPTLFFGLPGNPVSAMVTFELFVRPTLRKMRGLADVRRPTVQAHITAEATHEPGRRSFQRARLSREGDNWVVFPLSGQGSHQMRSLVEANALLIVPEDVTSLHPGDVATAIPLD